MTRAATTNRTGSVLWSGEVSGVPWEVLSLEGDGFEDRYLVNGQGKMQSGISRAGNVLVPAFKYAQAMVAEAIRGHSRILMLGAGGFCVPTCILRHNEGSRITVVDSEGWLENIAHRYFFKPQTDRIEFVQGKAEDLPSGGQGAYDLVLIDLFTSGGVVPENLFDPSFLEKIRQILAVDGAMIWNVSSGRDPWWRKIGGGIRQTLARAGFDCKAFSHPSQDVYGKCNVLFVHNPRGSLAEIGWVEFAVAEQGEVYSKANPLVWPGQVAIK